MGKNSIVSIMHISDLHKSPQDSYESLFRSLIDDCDIYSANGINKPDIVVVSGDLIKGGSTNEIVTQYSEVKDFLEKIVEYFLEGKKEHIVIVPGNHDVNWNISKASMQKISNTKENIDIFRSGIISTFRWSWEDLSLYEINDAKLYMERIQSFAAFYNDFYTGIQTYPLEPKEQYQVFDLPDYGITFFAYNSCFENDNLNLAGSINPVCFSLSSTLADKYHNLGRLLIAVWHHGITGLPNETNYMDKQILERMSDKHIKIGLFGHTHTCNVLNEYKSIFSDDKILLLGAGTVYGDRSSLPYRTGRQYNIIQLAFNDDNIELSFHSREDRSTEIYPIPVWGDGRIGISSQSEWCTTLPWQKTEISKQINFIMTEAEQKQDRAWGIQQLLKLDLNNTSVRSILLEYLLEEKEYKKICEIFHSPVSNDEAIYLMESAEMMADLDMMKKMINVEYIKENADSAVKEKRQMISLFLRSKGYGAN
ncbi:hypothetical protein AGMMS49546_20230 [Spirochaetia bacterium]|nr:hypothetical protein AGMMS49546_20230 [Spirochaetia bacterium]